MRRTEPSTGSADRRAGAAPPGRDRTVKTAEHLDGSELSRLQSRCRFERITEFEESLGGEGLEHAQLRNQQLVDADCAMKRRHRSLRTPGLELGHRVVKLVKDQLEPELICLMNDHEKHLVVRPLRKRVLEVEKLVDAQV